MTSATDKTTAKHRELQGVVVKKSGTKTVAVEVVRILQHPTYRKRIKRTKKYLAHDPQETCVVGQAVTIREGRPMSARKRWFIVYSATS